MEDKVKEVGVDSLFLIGLGLEVFYVLLCLEYSL